MAELGFELPYSFRPTKQVPVDYNYLFQLPLGRSRPYASTTEACATVPRGVRTAGLTVLVGDTEYRWLAGDLSDAGLKVKTVGGGVGGGGGIIRTTYGQALQAASGNNLNGGAVYMIPDFPNAQDNIYVLALDGNIFASDGFYLGSNGVVSINVDVPNGTFSTRGSTAGGNYVEPTFDYDIPASLSNGATWGKYKDGDLVPAKGKTARQLTIMALIDDKQPTYSPAAINVSQSAPSDGEVGEQVTNTITANFASNDAGNLVALRVLLNGALLGSSGSTTPHSETITRRRILGALSFQASADYLAGPLKNVQPAGTPDTRAPQSDGNPNAPQGARNDFRSGVVNFNGYFRFFFGPTPNVPTTSDAVRSLGSQPLTNAGNVFLLNTGSTEKVFTFAVPQGWEIANVIDLNASSADLTGQYVPATGSVKDAAGNPNPYVIYSMTPDVPYNSNHQHQVTLVKR
jgi:hypothetical protein